MPRSKNLDVVAPDDLITAPVSQPVTPVPAAMPSPPIQQKIYDILGHTKHSLSSLLVYPDVFAFQEQDDQETILLVARQHWFTNVGWILLAIAMVFFPTLLKFVPLLTAFPANYQFIGILFWYLLTFAFAFEKFLSWYFNVYIVTNKRVVDIDFNNLLIKKYSEAGLEKIQDTTSSVIGAIPTVFNYGDVLIQTASEVNEIEFLRVPNPDKIIKLLQDLKDNFDLKESIQP